MSDAMVSAVAAGIGMVGTTGLLIYVVVKMVRAMEAESRLRVENAELKLWRQGAVEQLEAAAVARDRLEEALETMTAAALQSGGPDVEDGDVPAHSILDGYRSRLSAAMRELRRVTNEAERPGDSGDTETADP